MHGLRFRQIHLDFHTSPFVPGIGEAFDKGQWQDRLNRAHVDSITCFSLCHHGWSYHPTQVGKMHPHLGFDLLRAQMDACKEIDVNVPVYLTAGVNNVAAYDHPEWREVDGTGRYTGWEASPLNPGFHKLCFNTPYLDYLCALIREAATLFPEADGIFLDIISQGQCCCRWCMDGMRKAGIHPGNPEERAAYAEQVLLKYYQATTGAARHQDSSMPVFHNSGHVSIGSSEILKYFSHLELESLPTGGWGYDHYPMSAAYVRKLGLDFLGMTGKFHTTWGEFGGFKHPNALRYECAAMLAQGSKCSIGDQLHPCGELDASTYDIIGQAYGEVEAKEPWCRDVVSAANVAVLSVTAVDPSLGREHGSDIGASRLLLESHIPFDVLDLTMDFNEYDVLILPDFVRMDEALAVRIQAFLDKGGKLVLSGESGLKSDGSGFALDLPVAYDGVSPWCPDYLLPQEAYQPEFLATPFVMYQPSQRIKVKGGETLGAVYDPYFNREGDHFCSHQHTPYRPEASGYDCGVMTGNVLYFAHPVFSIYRTYGAVLMKAVVAKALARFMGSARQVVTTLPSQGRVTLMHQPSENRSILHLLYANTVTRGASVQMSGGNIRNTSPVEVVEELNPVYDIDVMLRQPHPVKKVLLEPQGVPVSFEQLEDAISFRLDKLCCHQMIVVEH
jgi:hypothetical protein